MYSKPPRIIECFTSEVDPANRDYIERGFQNEWDLYGIKCSCGNSSIQLMGHLGQKPNGLKFLVDPIYIVCPVCHSRHELFDSRKQGCNGELGLVPLDRWKRDVGDFLAACKHCNGTAHELTLGFMYVGDEEEIIVEKGLHKNPEDLFQRLIGYIRCKGCGEVTHVIDIDCV